MSTKKIPEKWYDAGFSETYYLSGKDFLNLENYLKKISGKEIRFSDHQKTDLQAFTWDYHADFHRFKKEITPPKEQLKKIKSTESNAKKLRKAIESFDMLTIQSMAWANDIEPVEFSEMLTGWIETLETLNKFTEETIRKSSSRIKSQKGIFGEFYDGILAKKKGSIDKLIWQLADFFEQLTDKTAKQPTRNWNSEEVWEGGFYGFILLFIRTINIADEDYQTRNRLKDDDETTSRLAKIVINVLKKRRHPSS
jgi:hypothetical protein